MNPLKRDSDLRTLFSATLHSQQISAGISSPIRRIPNSDINCRKLIESRIKANKSSRKKLLQQVSTEKKLKKYKRASFIDDCVKVFKCNPGPTVYNTSFSAVKRHKSSQSTIASNDSRLKIKGKQAKIQNVEKHQQKNKYQTPPVGKYNLLSRSDFRIKRKSLSVQDLQRKQTKPNFLQNTRYLSNQTPGPGMYNAHKQVPKLRINTLGFRDQIKKHKEEKARTQQKAASVRNLSGCSYSPIHDKTFDLISKTSRSQRPQKKVAIDRRLGLSSKSKSPGPGSYNLLNKWAQSRSSRQKLIGKLKIFSQTTSSFPSLRVYS